MTRETPTHTETDCQVMRETAAAMQVCCASGELIWVPFSQIVSTTRNPKVKMSDTVVMTRWIAQQKGLL